MVTMEEVKDFYCVYIADGERDPWEAEQIMTALYEFANRGKVAEIEDESKVGESQANRSRF